MPNQEQFLFFAVSVLGDLDPQDGPEGMITRSFTQNDVDRIRNLQSLCLLHNLEEIRVSAAELEYNLEACEGNLSLVWVDSRAGVALMCDEQLVVTAKHLSFIGVLEESRLRYETSFVNVNNLDHLLVGYPDHCLVPAEANAGDYLAMLPDEEEIDYETELKRLVGAEV